MILRAWETETHFRVETDWRKCGPTLKWISVYLLRTCIYVSKFQFTCNFSLLIKFSVYRNFTLHTCVNFSLPAISVYSWKFRFTCNFNLLFKFRFTFNLCWLENFSLPAISVYPYIFGLLQFHFTWHCMNFSLRAINLFFTISLLIKIPQLQFNWIRFTYNFYLFENFGLVHIWYVVKQ